MGSLIQLRSRNSPAGDRQAEYDLATQETILRVNAAVLDEDFCGPGHTTIPAAGSPAAGYPWVKNTATGSGTVSVLANFSGGAVACALAATSEAEEATLYANDMLNWDASKSAVFEARLAMSVLPTGVAEALFGLRAARNAVPDSAAVYIDFQMLGNGNVNVRIKDGVTSVQSVATGVTLAAGVFHNFRFDASDPTNVQFFIDGIKVSPVASAAAMTFAATGASAVLQPYFAVYKTATTDVATMQVDSCQIGMNRS
ncbi:MAG TPA: hypothetical protein VMS01_04270 [Stellaceae bacterium]|nr:hypothetical protein [Stellaceae bacterium]